MRLPCGVCDDYSNITVSVMRSLGIPVACDFTPHWPVRASGHTWNVVKGNNGNNLTFGGADTNPDQPHNFDEKKSKIFRHTYAANPELKRLHEEAEYVPETFQLPFMKDVTREYMDCKDVEVVCHVGTGYALSLIHISNIAVFLQTACGFNIKRRQNVFLASFYRE